MEQLELRGAIVNDSTKMNLLLDVSCIENWEKYQTNLENLYESKGELFQKALDIPRSTRPIWKIFMRAKGNYFKKR